MKKKRDKKTGAEKKTERSEKCSYIVMKKEDTNKRPSVIDR